MRNLKKLLAVIVAICLIATLSVPAFAADATYGTQATTLNTLGLYDGISATSFDPDLGTAVDRQTAIALLVKMLGKKAEASAMAAADQDAALANFTDAKDLAGWAKPFMAYAVKNGMVKGTSDTTLAPKDAVTGNMYATFILRNLGYTVDDVNTGLATLQTKGGLTAAQATAFAKDLIKDDIVGISFGALQAANKDGKKLINVLVDAKVVDAAKATAANVYTAAASSATLTATGAKILTVTFDGPVDTAKVAFAVTKSGVAVNKSTVTWNDAKTVATITLAGKMTAGDYTVATSGITATALSNKVTVTDEKVAKINFTSTNAVLDSADTKVVTTSYTVLNQYNEDVTSASLAAGITFSTVKGNATGAAGTLTIDNNGHAGSATDTAYASGDKLAISAFDTNSTTFASTVLTVVDKAQVASVSISNIYNLTDSTATVTPTVADGKSYALVMSVKDQYGNAIPAGSVAAGVYVSVTPTTNCPISFVAWAADPNDSSKVDWKFTTSAANAGTATVTVISLSTGQKASFDVAVKDLAKVDTLTVSAPSVTIAAGDSAKAILPFTAVDQFGNAVTDAASLNAVTITPAATKPVFVHDYVKNVTNLEWDVSGMAKGTYAYTFITPSNKISTIVLTVADAAYAAVITGVTPSTTIAKHGTLNIGIGDLTYNDQYGRSFTPTTATNSVKFSTGTAANVDLDGAGADLFLNAGNPAITLGALAKGTSAITVSLYNAAGTTLVSGSDYTFTAKVVDTTDFTSYSLVAPGKIYNATDHAISLEVDGVMADGSKVALPRPVATPDEYYRVDLISAPAGFSFDGAASKLVANAIAGGFDATTNEQTVPFVVTVFGNGTTPVLTGNAVVSDTDPSVASIAIKDAASYAALGVGTVTVEDATNNVLSISAAECAGAADLTALVSAAVKATDQYGFGVATGALTVIYSNNSNGHAVTALAANDTFTVTVISANGKVLTAKVIVKP